MRCATARKARETHDVANDTPTRTTVPKQTPLAVDFEGAGQLLGVSPWTVRRLVDSGELPIIRLPGRGRDGRQLRRCLVAVADIEALICRSRA